MKSIIYFIQFVPHLLNPVSSSLPKTIKSVYYHQNLYFSIRLKQIFILIHLSLLIDILYNNNYKKLFTLRDVIFIISSNTFRIPVSIDLFVKLINIFSLSIICTFDQKGKNFFMNLYFLIDQTF